MRKRGESASPPATSFLRFLAFDEPSLQTRNLTTLQTRNLANLHPSDDEWNYESRFASLLSSIPIHHPNIPATSCKSTGRKHIKEFVSKVIQNGGEGIVVREPGSLYVGGLSDSFFKFKAERDQEGLILAVLPSSYTLRLPDGKILEIDKRKKKEKEAKEEEDNEDETTIEEEEQEIETEKEKKNEKDRKVIYQIGDVVTFTFSHYDLAGLPARAKLQRKREDVRWEDIVVNFWDKSNSSKHLGEISQRVLDPIVHTKKPVGHWTVDGSKNIRKFFDELAHSWNKDPMDPETWYTFGLEDLVKAKGISILRHYGNSVIKALMNVYPNIGLDELKFDRVSHKFWDSEANRKLFFDNYAKKKGFDPLVPGNWYNVTRSSIEAEKGGYVLQRGGYLVSSLMSLYPDIGLDPSKFTFTQKWKDRDFHIKFFKEFAKNNNFDPLVPDNWYNITKREIIEVKGAFTVLATFNGSFKRALISSFPDIGIQEDKFSIVRPRYWTVTENRKYFFDTFAEERGFDPLIASNWYSVTIDDIKNKSGKHVLKYCENSLSKALVDAYPDIGLDLSLFRVIPKRHWSYPSNARRFLDNFAAQRGFDPLVASNWYSITSDDIQKEKGGSRFLLMNNNSVVSAIISTYPDIGIQEYKFTNYSRHFWTKEVNLKRFFDQYATKHSFDPLVSSHWYSVSPDDIRSEDKGYSVLQRHGGSLMRALKHAYPSLILEDNKFTPSRVWMDAPQNRRKFFDDFAKKMNFNPLISTNWVSVSRKTLIKEKRGKYCLSYYEGSLEKALIDVYKFSKIF